MLASLDWEPDCPFPLKPLGHLFHPRASATGAEAPFHSLDLACAGGYARPYSETEMLAWTKYGLDYLSSPGLSDEDEDEDEDGRTPESTDSDGPRTPPADASESGSSCTLTPSRLAVSTTRTMPEIEGLAELLCPATHCLPSSPPSSMLLREEISSFSSASPPSAKKALPWVREQHEWDGRRTKPKPPQGKVRREREPEGVWPGREAPPPSPAESREHRLVELLPSRFLFRYPKAKSVSSAVILRNVHHSRIAYKIHPHPPKDMPKEQKGRYTTLFRVRGSFGLLAPGQEVRLRAMYCLPCPELVSACEGKFSLLLQVAVVPPRHGGQASREEVNALLKRNGIAHKAELAVFVPPVMEIVGGGCPEAESCTPTEAEAETFLLLWGAASLGMCCLVLYLDFGLYLGRRGLPDLRRAEHEGVIVL
ncbi:hypothetical protein CALVIDRAFT_596877 [Calocera viscosa TUFC12733]|uniref:MSP domain-containing protein n=1 Tax=Calocera viscosa (strain TUFC12733) TaxID=1330018 RepID=A0A167P2C3_CALVF|nr:hypothetical protein CALVIDRAFT_596877 [Calocera viscosa TUFC12733]